MLTILKCSVLNGWVMIALVINIYSLQSADKATKTIRDPLPTSEERSTLVSSDKEF